MSPEQHTSPDTNILKVQDLSIKISTPTQDLYILEKVNFSIRKGKCLAVIGESGCGKSMTANAIMRLLPQSAYYSSGSKIYFANEDLLELPEYKMRDIRGSKVGMIFQDPMSSLNPVLSIQKQLYEAIHSAGITSAEGLYERAISLLEQVKIPDPKGCLLNYPHELSGGMKQRVMIAMMLAAEPELLIADEPTTALDVSTELAILDIIRELQQQSELALLLITHNLNVAKKLADDIAVMYAGTIIEYGSLKQILTQAKHPYTQKLMAAKPHYNLRNQQLVEISGCVPKLNEQFNVCRFIERCTKVTQMCKTSYPPENTTDGHFALCWNSEEPATQQSNPATLNRRVTEKTIFSVSNLNIDYQTRSGFFNTRKNAFRAVKDVSFDLNQGEALAIVGESGSGKTTLAKGIMGLVDITSGDIRYKNTISIDNRKQYLNNIQIVFQDPYSALNPKLTIYEAIAEAVACRSDFDPKNIHSEVNKLLDLVGLAGTEKHKYPHEFSGGQRQRICIARALAVRPSLIICDEPTSALDLSIQAQILNLLLELKNKADLSYIFITHDLSVVSYIADKVAVMHQGRIVEYGAVQQILFKPLHEYTKSLLESYHS